MTKALHELEAGDEVIIQGGGVYDYLAVRVIDRTTKTQIIVGNGRFRRDSGFRVGASDSYSQGRAYAPTPALRKRAQQHADESEAYSLAYRISKAQRVDKARAVVHLRAAWAVIQDGGAE